MPRKAYVAHLEELCNASPALVPNVSSVKRGDDDGTFLFTFAAPELGIDEVEFSGMIPELSDYPDSHQCFVYATGDAPGAMASAIENLYLDGRQLKEILAMVSYEITKAVGAGAASQAQSDDEMMDEEEESDDASVGGWSDDEVDVDGDSQMAMPGFSGSDTHATARKAMVEALRADLKAAKQAGFRVGVLGDYKSGGMDLYVSIAIRVSKLGISEEALSAWKLDRTKYFLLLLHYTQGYKTLDKLTQDIGYHTRRGVEICVSTHARYKPTIAQAIAAFSKVRQGGDGDPLIATEDGLETESQAAKEKEPQLEPMFLSGPLHELLNTRLVQMLKYRMNFGFSWDGAELYYNDHQGRETTASDVVENRYYEIHQTKKTFVDVVVADGLCQSPQTHSFPLLAMQYALRHLVRCTEFCLICHQRVSADFEALKPYVCSNPLCLYQYMSLGFGPSIEHEIISQPTVVDLLISFCYSSARNSVLNTFPDGMSLMVPNMKDGTVYTCQYQRHKHEMECEPDLERPPLRVGDWIVVTMDLYPNFEWHTRVLEVDYFPKIVVANPIKVHAFHTPTSTPGGVNHIGASPGASTPFLNDADNAALPTSDPMISLPGTADIMPVKFRIYDTNFDTLSSEAKRETISSLLYTLPRVSEMKTWLQRNTKVSEEASLKKWINRISPAALGCLRWIIASNRSCIVALDDFEAESEGKENSVMNQKVYGMDGWLQFRFAMGAPDKEQRFVNSVRSVGQISNSNCPTLFAFHGSPLYNWHSIIREGLHFNKTLNGRAYGHGCYHSLDLGTSSGYTRSAYYNSTSHYPMEWPHSDLNFTTALSLNEIVNSPDQFVSKSPHLVVAQLDWIQTRYLFIQCEQRNIATGKLIKPDNPLKSVTKPTNPRPQDPHYTPTSGRNKLVIPASSGSVQQPATPTTNGNVTKKKARTWMDRLTKTSSAAASPEFIDDAASVCTDASDREFLFPDAPPPRAPVSLKRTHSRIDAFTPGTLDYANIPILSPPSYASNSATKRLQSDLAALIRTQSSPSTNLEQLGFYLNPDKVENVYQWIVELHSFPEHLPLVQDMRAKSPPLSSVVLELRFGPQYPMSPPFVRVIKPRFLGFQQGGGGNVTLGGALCMELLTNTGWSAVNSVESVLLQVRMAICDEERPARLESGPVRTYGVEEAREAYLRACRAHGWEVPTDFQRMV